MKRLIAAGLLLATPAFAEEVDADTVAKIEAMLTAMDCQMDPDDIELEDGVYDLDDVMCKGGQQFDLKLDADLNEIDRKAE
ncbi:PepSY domain-containing protein [Tropicibacter sp. S64]|uniref:PepSY domain-containing protein n=1 Tax=Tropicibacter sp. S64 TaxID=3415122 RepID=UPI003C7AA3A1